MLARRTGERAACQLHCQCSDPFGEIPLTEQARAIYSYDGQVSGMIDTQHAMDCSGFERAATR